MKFMKKNEPDKKNIYNEWERNYFNEHQFNTTKTI